MVSINNFKISPALYGIIFAVIIGVIEYMLIIRLTNYRVDIMEQIILLS